MSLRFDETDSARLMPAADITAPHAGSNVTTTQRSLPVKLPEKDAGDFVIEVNASDLRRIRRTVESCRECTLPRHDLLLGLACLFAGSAMSAVISQVALSSWQGVLFYILAPVVATGALVWYLCDRRLDSISASRLANDLLAEIPNPDRAVQKEVKS